MKCTLVEGKGHDRKWISEKPTSCDCGDHVGCKQEICINDDGHAKTFKNVCEGLKYMHDKTDRIVIAVGLGKCKALYSSKFSFLSTKRDEGKLNKDLYKSVLISLLCSVSVHGMVGPR